VQHGGKKNRERKEHEVIAGRAKREKYHDANDVSRKIKKKMFQPRQSGWKNERKKYERKTK
jgi:hypothetical protein